MEEFEGRAGRINVGPRERVISAGLGIALIAYGLKTKGWRRNAALFAGGNLLNRGATGRCPVYRALGIRTADQARDHQKGIKVSETVLVRGTPGEVYGFWRNLENLPRIMRHLESVKIIDERRSRGKAAGPAGTDLTWEAEIVRDIPNELITWQSLDGADVVHAGSVAFKPAQSGEGTEVKVTLRYDPPGGALGAAMAGLLGEDPSLQIEQDLKSFKDYMESGSLAGARR
jgi:uncharacterized membrane protein